LYNYINLLKIKWLFLGAISAFSLSAHLVFVLLPTPEVVMSWALWCFLSIFIYSLFHEWYMSPENTKWGKACKYIIDKSYKRTASHQSAEENLFDVKLIIASFVLLFLLGVFAWSIPEQEYWIKWLFTLISGFFGTYVFNEEFNAKPGSTQRYAFWLSMSIFTAIVFVVYLFSVYGLKYSDQPNEFPLFIITIASWFSFGVIASSIRAAFVLYKKKKVGATKL
jgi:hypothetical protein